MKKEINTKIPLHDLTGKVIDHIQLNKTLFSGRVNHTLLYEVKKMYEANMRRGTASVKRRDEVSGGGVKPWRQKGTGRARAGSIRSPLWRHGGSIFGPKPRDYSYSMPRKAVRGALLSSLNARLREDAIKAIVKMEMKEPKTKAFRGFIDNLKVDGKVLVAADRPSEALKKSSRNLGNVTLKDVADINARDVLLNDNFVIEKEAVGRLTERLK